MKSLILILTACGFVFTCAGQENQEMVYKSGFIFRQKQLKKRGDLFVIQPAKKEQQDTVGSFLLAGAAQTTWIVKSNMAAYNQYRAMTIPSKRLLGSITKRNEDSVFIKFWPIVNDPFKDQKNLVNTSSADSNFVYVIKKWKGSKAKFDFPFKFNQLMATNLPFRVLTKTGDLESEFLNANISLQHVRGSNRIYKSVLMSPRSRYYAVGPYVGLSAIDNPVTTKKEFGLNAGVNLVLGLQSLNLTVAYGFQKGFKTGTKDIQPYIGFGIGFDLLETFIPEIKSEEE
jgi:hypothetical protein